MATQQPLVLVVDDQIGVRRLIQEIFRDSEVRVATAGHGQEALAVAGLDAPRVVLLDMKMPVMDGLETLRALKSMHPQVPVIMMTAVGDGERVQEALASGAFTCIHKPFDVFELQRLIEDLLQKEAES